jgi:hypothetical protein
MAATASDEAISEAASKHGELASVASAMKVPVPVGSPVHHWALRTKLPLLTKPIGAFEFHVSSYNPDEAAGLKDSMMVWPGARKGKSKSTVGVPFRKGSAVKFAVTSQSA